MDKTDVIDETIALQQQLAAARYALNIAEQLLRRINVEIVGNKCVVEMANEAGRIGGKSSNRYTKEWLSDRDAWLENRP